MTVFKSYAQNFEDIMLWRALRDVKDGFYIDVGAADPFALSVTAGFYDKGWRGLNVEPQEAYFERLQSARPDDINIRAVVSEEAGSKTLYTVHWRDNDRSGTTTGLTSLSKEIADSHDDDLFVVKPTEIRSITLSQVCKLYAPDVIHFLKVDVEGAEATVLRSLDFQQYRPWIVLVEATEPTPISKTSSEAKKGRQPKRTSADWAAILTDNDYQCVWFDGLNEFYVSGEKHDHLAHHFELPPNVFDGFSRPSVPKQPTVDPLKKRLLDTPATLSAKKRIALSGKCSDADHLPRVKDAGKVFSNKDGIKYQVMHNGLKIVADGYCGPWMTDLIREGRGVHEPQEEALFADVLPLLSEAATMLEVGAYWSFYSLWFLMGSPDRTAYTLEPDPAHSEIGEQNAKLNDLAPIKLPNGFIGSRHRKSVPFEGETSGGLHLPCRSVSDIMEEKGIERLNLLHCDAQGAEVEMLKGCKDLFRDRRVDWVFVSTHHHQISGDPLTHQMCETILRDAGATLVRSIDVQESYSGDGLIVARFCGVPKDWTASKTTYCRTSESLFRNPLIDLAKTPGFQK